MIELVFRGNLKNAAINSYDSNRITYMAVIPHMRCSSSASAIIQGCHAPVPKPDPISNSFFTGLGIGRVYKNEIYIDFT